MAGALTFGILGAGSGIAGAKPNPGPHPNPPGPGVSAPANPGNGHGNGNGHVNGSVNGDVNDDVNGDVDADEGGTWSGGNVNPAWVPGMPPGQNPFGPPGQVKNLPTLTLSSPLTLANGTVIPAGTVVANPFLNTPPGKWGTVDLNTVLNGIDPSVLSWLPPNPGITSALPLVWNPDFNNGAGAWGVYLPTDNSFVVYPLPLPAPNTTG